MAGDDAQLVEAWRGAAVNPEVVADLEAVFTLIADQIAAQDPACWGSGRCCAFGKAGHRLYVTGLEAAYTLARVATPVTLGDLDGADARDDCPFLRANLCGVHAVKPVACRVYFCDASAKTWQWALAERTHEMVRRLHERHGVAYRYAPWRSLLRMLVAGG